MSIPLNMHCCQICINHLGLFTLKRTQFSCAKRCFTKNVWAFVRILLETHGNLRFPIHWWSTGLLAKSPFLLNQLYKSYNKPHTNIK